VSGISDFLKKDISFKRKPPATAEADTTTTTTTEEPKSEAPKRNMSVPKRAPKQRKTSAASSGGRHKQLVGLSIGASELAAAVVVNNGKPKLVKAVRHTLPADIVAAPVDAGQVRAELGNRVIG